MAGTRPRAQGLGGSWLGPEHSRRLSSPRPVLRWGVWALARVRRALAAAAFLAVLVALLPGCSGSDPLLPESAPSTSGTASPDAPSATGEATDDGPIAAVSTGADEEAPSGPAGSIDDQPAAGSTAAGDPETAVEPSVGGAVDQETGLAAEPSAGDPADEEAGLAAEPSVGDPAVSDPEFAVEIIEELAPGVPVGGARQEEPLGPIWSEESGDSGREISTEGATYTWRDGDRVLGAVLQPDLTVLGRDEVERGQDVVGETGQGQIVIREADEAPGTRGASGAQGTAGASSSQPVFLSESGELMTLPGGVILALDEGWDSDATGSFFARNGISLDRVSELDYLTNGFIIDTEPGFPSLELANALATQPGVELSSPNWSRERTTR